MTDNAPPLKPKVASYFGPWVMDLEPGELKARLRSLRLLVMLFDRPNTELLNLLRKAETDTIELWNARFLFEKLPALKMRKILSAYVYLHNMK